jgi:hypothetical protein
MKIRNCGDPSEIFTILFQNSFTNCQDWLHTVTWNTVIVAGDVYFYCIPARNYTDSKKAVIDEVERRYSVINNGSKLSSGIYFTRMIVQPLEGKSIVQVKKMLLTK